MEYDRDKVDEMVLALLWLTSAGDGRIAALPGPKDVQSSHRCNLLRARCLRSRLSFQSGRLSANSRPGSGTKNPALYPVHEVPNSTTAIGMRASLFLKGLGQSELARYYDSRTGTFCSADPLAGDPGDPQSWNRYPYGRNDPIDITDPSGKSWWSSLLIDIGAAAAAFFVPEVLPALTGEATAATAGSVTVTVLGQSSTAYYLWGVDSSVIGFTAAEAAQLKNPRTPQQPQPPQAKFIDCNSKYGTQNSQGNLTYQGYQDAAQAANSAHIPVSNELALWDNENSLNLTTKVPVGPSGEIGPMQLTPPAYNTLSKLRQLPSGWNDPGNPTANVLAGARYFAHILKSQPLSNGAAVYNGGTGCMKSSAAQNYQKNFNSKNTQLQKLVNCMH